MRRRPVAPTAPGSGVPRTINSYEFAPVRQASRETDRWTLDDQNWLSFKVAGEKQSSIHSWTNTSGFVTGEEMDDDTERGESSGGTSNGIHDEFMGLEANEMDVLLEPKVESPDEMQLVSMQESEATLSSAVSTTEGGLPSPCQPKRPRGRPRKHPVPTKESLAKVAKGRSKTGCITCRKRKKKCDEAKPRCE